MTDRIDSRLPPPTASCDPCIGFHMQALDEALGVADARGPGTWRAAVAREMR